MMSAKKYLDALSHQIPFLKQIPEAILYNLDTSELYLPSAGINALREQLESQLGHYVMTYKADVFNRDVPPKRHLCVNLQGAQLSPAQLAVLSAFEAKVRAEGVSFVVYQRPLTLIAPENSPMGTLNQSWMVRE